jgi:integrase
MKAPVKTPDGWRVDYRDQFGNRYRYTYHRKQDAQQALDDARAAIKDGSFVAAAEVPTFSEVAEQWFATKQAQNRRPNTLEQYRTHLDNHLLPELGRLRLNQIDVDRIERMRDTLLADTTKKVTAPTVNKLLTTASAIFKVGIKHKKCANNPAELADRLQVSEAITDEDGAIHRVSSRPVTDEDILTPEEIQKLSKHAKAGLPYTLLLTAAATGARHNELLALRWGDIDFDGGAIQIRRSLTWVKAEAGGREPTFYPPKTRAGRRRIPLPPALIQALRVYYLQTHFKAPGDLIFQTREGRAMHHRTVRRDVLERTRKQAKLRGFTMHSLRHTFASSLLQAGASITEVQRYMGHNKSAHVTLDVYAHFMPTADSGAVTAHVARLLPYGHSLDTLAAPAPKDAADAAVSA